VVVRRLEDLLESQGRTGLGEASFVGESYGQQLATKRLSAQERGVDQLVMSMRTLAQVSHPALVPIVEVTGEDDSVWVRSEDAPGVSLRRLLVVTSLTPTQAAMIGLGILDGLAALQAAGRAHGDLHANNVHVGPDGGVRLSGGGLLPLLIMRDADGWRDADAVAVANLVMGMAGEKRRQGPAWRVPPAQDLVEAARAIRRATIQTAGDQRAPDAALGALRRKASALLPEDMQGQTAAELGALVRALSLRPAPRVAPVPVHPPDPEPPSHVQIPQLSRRARRWAIAVALVVVLCLSMLLVGWLWWLKHPHWPAVRLPALGVIVVLPADQTVFLPPASARGSGR